MIIVSSKTSSVSESKIFFSVAMRGCGSKVLSSVRQEIIESESFPLNRITAIPLRPKGVARATIVFFIHSKFQVTNFIDAESDTRNPNLFKAHLKPPVPTRPDRLGDQIAFFLQSQMNYAALSRI